ncbi:MAG: phosphatidylserine decarboxylase [Defluviitaleaceae bacterium]|nr:phosphatidylserine decarboxylase [Defluviitaleaceae bacterium]
MAHKQADIWVYNPGSGQHEKEIICAEKWLRIIYESPVGSATLQHLLKRKMLSRLYGMYCRTRQSAKGIPQFIEQNKVDMTGCQGPYNSFADFFSREKQGITFPEAPDKLGAPCEGVAFAHTDISKEKLIAAKGSYFSLAELFDDEALADAYQGGTMLQIRLAPANYHRLHFFDDGMVTGVKFIDGDLFSVSPLAVRRVARLYCQNKRALISFSSQHFGDVVMVEVGATFVGSMVHCFEENERVQRGQLASYFLPGGSLVLFFFKKGMFTPKETLLEQTLAGYETKICVGEVL